MRQQPGALLILGRRRRLIRHLQQVVGTVDVAKQLAQVRRVGQCRQIAGAKIEHPLRRRLRILVIAKFGVRFGQQAVDHDVIRNLLVQRLGQIERGGELMFAQQDRDLNLLGIEVVRSQLQRLLDVLVGLRVVAGVGGLSRAANQRCGEKVVTRVLRGFVPDQALRLRHVSLRR